MWFSSSSEKAEKCCCYGIISVETKQNTSSKFRTECCFFVSCLLLLACQSCQGAAEWERSSLCVLALLPLSPDGAQQKWFMLSPHLQRLQHSSPGNWTSGRQDGAESLCQATAGSPELLVFLPLCDVFRGSLACAAYLLWAAFSAFPPSGQIQSAFRFGW